MKPIGKYMQRFVLSVALLLLVFACGPLPQEEQAESAVGITAPDGYSVSCASNYTRVLPHFCKVQTFGSPTSLTIDGSCRSINLNTLYSVPTTAKAVLLHIEHIVTSNNAIGQHLLTSRFYNDISCAAGQSYPNIEINHREAVAVVASTIAIFDSMHGPIVLASGAVLPYVISLANCTGCSMTVVPIGYYD